MRIGTLITGVRVDRTHWMWRRPGRWGRRSILAASMLVTTTIAYAGFFTFVAIGRAEILVASGANVTPQGTEFIECNVDSGPGTVEDCSDSADGRAGHGQFSGISTSSVLSIVRDYLNEEDEAVCVSVDPSGEPKVIYTLVGPTEKPAGGGDTWGISVAFDPSLVPSDSFDLTYTLTFETISSAGGSCP